MLSHTVHTHAYGYMDIYPGYVLKMYAYINIREREREILAGTQFFFF